MMAVKVFLSFACVCTFMIQQTGKLYSIEKSDLARSIVI